MPELHATRAFARRHQGRVWLNYFQETQRGKYHWDVQEKIVSENRTEALDASRQILRDQRVILPRRSRLVEVFAQHVAADAKRLEENDETGALAYKYIKTGTNHFSLAFTYDCIASSRFPAGPVEARIGSVVCPIWNTRW